MNCTCLSCGKVFNALPSRIKTGRGKYCSKDCMNHALGVDILIPCLRCGELFHPLPGNIRKGYGKFCSAACYGASMKGISHNSGSSNPMWNGGRTIDSAGYVRVFCPGYHRSLGNNQVMEHLLVAENILGRHLNHNEAVHHINGIKSDNRPENLFVFPSGGEHTRYHHQVKAKRCKPITESNLITCGSQRFD